MLATKTGFVLIRRSMTTCTERCSWHISQLARSTFPLSTCQPLCPKCCLTNQVTWTNNHRGWTLNTYFSVFFFVDYLVNAQILNKPSMPYGWKMSQGKQIIWPAASDASGPYVTLPGLTPPPPQKKEVTYDPDENKYDFQDKNTNGWTIMCLIYQ